MTLFRQQDVDHFLRSSDGAVLQVGRLPYRNFCLFIVFFLLCLLAFLRWGRYVQTEVVTGGADSGRGLFARLIGLQRQRIAAQEQLHRQEVQVLDTAIDHAQRQIRLAQAQRTQQNRLAAKAVVGSTDPAE